MFYIRTDADEFVYFDGHEGEWCYDIMSPHTGAKMHVFATLEGARKQLFRHRGMKGTPSIYGLGGKLIETLPPTPTDE